MSRSPADPSASMPVAKHLDRLGVLIKVEGRRIVDVGCGDGALVRALARRGALVTGIEIDARALAPARAADPVAAERYLEGRAEALPLDDGSVDVVIFFNSLHHVPGDVLDQALAEAARVLVSGGYLFVLEPIAAGPYFEVTRLVEDETAVRAEAYAALGHAGAHGFSQLVEEVYWNPLTFAGFDGFTARLAAVDPARQPVIDRHRDTLRQAFQAAAEQTAEGHRFYQPTRINLFRRR